MSRKPIDEQIKDNEPRGQEHYWKVMNDLDCEEGFSLDEVYNQTNAPKPTIKEFFTRIIKAGFINVVRSEHDGPIIKRNYYRIAKRSRFAPKVRKDGTICPPTKRDVLWRTMRMNKRFTPKELVIWASLPETEIKLNDAKDYIKNLYKAGYLKTVGKTAGNVSPTYLLVKDTGPLPPKIQRVKQVYDQNLKQVVCRSEVKS